MSMKGSCYFADQCSQKLCAWNCNYWTPKTKTVSVEVSIMPTERDWEKWNKSPFKKGV